MPIPGRLTLEVYNKETGIITLEAAADIENKNAILRDEPRVYLPYGGVLTLGQRTDYAIARSISETARDILKLGDGGHGDGIYDDILNDPSIPTHLAARNKGDAIVTLRCQYMGGWSFNTPNRKFRKGQKQTFTDLLLLAFYVGLVQQVTTKVESIGTDIVFDCGVTVDVFRVTIEDTLESIVTRQNRPALPPRLRIGEGVS